MPKAAAPPASEIPSYQVTDKRLRRIMAPRADGTHIVPQQILDSWKDTATGGREQIIKLFNECKQNKDMASISNSCFSGLHVSSAHL